MNVEIMWLEQLTLVDLVDGRVSVGGGENDHIRIEGLPKGLLEFVIEKNRLCVTSTDSIRFGSAVFPAHVPRLVLPGESLTLPNDVTIRVVPDLIQQEQRKAIETAHVARELLKGNNVSGETPTRAASLTCVAGPDQGTAFLLAFANVVIGRNDSADVRLNDTTVSRMHAAIRQRGHTFMIENKNRTNGVYVNGEQVTRPQKIDHGDLIELGRSVLRFDSGAKAPSEMTVLMSAPLSPPPSSPPAVAAQEPETPRVSSQEPTQRLPHLAPTDADRHGRLMLIAAACLALCAAGLACVAS